MQFAQKTLKAFSFDLLHDLEESMLDTLEVGVINDWDKWFSLTNTGVMDKAIKTAVKNKRPTDFTNFKEFKQNIDFGDYVELITSYASKGNDYFSKLFKNARDKSYLQQAIGEANRFRNLIYHPAGKTLYTTDIRDFLKSGQVICNLIGLSSLSIRFKKIGEDIDNAIAESHHYIKEGVETVYNNLPKPDYDDWSGLVGREEIKREIIADFNRGHNRVIAITGGGGIGKTALAISIGYEFIKATNYQFNHIIWITSKNNFLDYSGIKELKPDFFYANNYKDFLNQFISGFYQELYSTNLESISEEELEKEIAEIFESYSRILFIVDNLENIDDPKILHFIKNKIIPPNFVLITSRNGLGEINKTYKLEPLDDASALILFQNLCKSPSFRINYSSIPEKKIKELLKKTNNYPLVIKWCLSLVANKSMELEAAFLELNKPHNALLEFIFQKLYKQLSKNSKRILRSLALYKDLPDRNIISYIAELDSEEALMDAIFELEQHSLIKQERIDSKHGIIETINLLGLAQTFINNIIDIDNEVKDRIQLRIIEIETELDKVTNNDNKDFRPAQRLAQSKLLSAYKISSEGILKKKIVDNLINEAERLAPRFYILPFYKALIAISKGNYEYGEVKELLSQSIMQNSEDPRVLAEYAKLIKRHKATSYNEYAPIFAKAFKLSGKIGYGIDAGIAYFNATDYNTSFDIITKIKSLEAQFPRDVQNKLWTSKVIIQLAENNTIVNQSRAFELLNSVETNIDAVTQTKSKESRMLKGKYCCLTGLHYALINEPIKSKEFINAGKSVVETYKSVDKATMEMKELICYIHLSEALLSNDNVFKSNKLKTVEGEFNGQHRKVLSHKFGAVIKAVKKSIQ